MRHRLSDYCVLTMIDDDDLKHVILTPSELMAGYLYELAIR